MRAHALLDEVDTVDVEKVMVGILLGTLNFFLDLKGARLEGVLSTTGAVDLSDLVDLLHARETALTFVVCGRTEPAENI